MNTKITVTIRFKSNVCNEQCRLDVSGGRLILVVLPESSLDKLAVLDCLWSSYSAPLYPHRSSSPCQRTLMSTLWVSSVLIFQETLLRIVSSSTNRYLVVLRDTGSSRNSLCLLWLTLSCTLVAMQRRPAAVSGCGRCFSSPLTMIMSVVMSVAIKLTIYLLGFFPTVCLSWVSFLACFLDSCVSISVWVSVDRVCLYFLDCFFLFKRLMCCLTLWSSLDLLILTSFMGTDIIIWLFVWWFSCSSCLTGWVSHITPVK